MSRARGRTSYELEYRLYVWMCEFQFANDRPPTFAECIEAGWGKSTSVISYRIDKLEELDLVVREETGRRYHIVGGSWHPPSQYIRIKERIEQK